MALKRALTVNHDADSSSPGDTPRGLTSAGRVFRSFHHWSLVPVSDLLRLKHKFEREPGGATQELLGLVDAELARRSSSTEGIIPPPDEDQRPEAG